MNTANVAVLVGSLRQASFSRKIANAVIALAPDSLRLEIVESTRGFLGTFVTAFSAWIVANTRVLVKVFAAGRTPARTR